MNNLQAIYDFYVIAQSRIQGLKNISIVMSESGMVMLFTWQTAESGMTPNISYLITKTELEYLTTDITDRILERVENAYKVWEVGEE